MLAVNLVILQLPHSCPCISLQVVGCDNILGSGKVKDECLQCPSSNSQECHSVSRGVSVPLQPSAVITGWSCVVTAIISRA